MAAQELLPQQSLWWKDEVRLAPDLLPGMKESGRWRCCGLPENYRHRASSLQMRAAELAMVV